MPKTLTGFMSNKSHIIDLPRKDCDVAASYVNTIPLTERRLAGQVYTPLHLVVFILEQAGFTEDQPIESAPFLDPACGGGIFLEVAVKVLAARLSNLGVNLKTTTGHNQLLQVVEDNLYGVDLDPRACDLTRQATRQAVAAVSQGPLPKNFFKSNVLQADFLLEDNLQESFPQAGFSFVVGNPPYVPATRIENGLKNELHSRYQTANGRMDYYTLFIERSLHLVRDKGRVAFITPNKYLISRSARPLRTVIKRFGHMVSMASFTSHKVFENAATVPCVTVLERNRRATAIRVLQCGDQPTPEGRVPVLKRFSVPAKRLSGDTWEFIDPKLLSLASRIKANHLPLEVYAARISAGFATGRDSIYVIPAGGEVDVEPDLLRPAVRGRDLSPYHIDDSGSQIIIPYSYDSADTPCLVDIRDYPKARKYLGRFKSELQQRHCVREWGKAWYDLHDPVPFDIAKKPKVLVPDVADHNQFVYDNGRFCPLHSVYYILPIDIDAHFLTAVLNTSPIEFLIRLHAPIVKDGFRRYRRQFLAMLPIPKADKKSAMAIIGAAKKGDAERAEDLVLALFRLGKADRKMITDHLDRRSRQGE